MSSVERDGLEAAQLRDNELLNRILRQIGDGAINRALSARSDDERREACYQAAAVRDVISNIHGLIKQAEDRSRPRAGVA